MTPALAQFSDWVLALLPRLFIYPGGLWMLMGGNTNKFSALFCSAAFVKLKEPVRIVLPSITMILLWRWRV